MTATHFETLEKRTFLSVSLIGDFNGDGTDDAIVSDQGLNHHLFHMTNGSASNVTTPLHHSWTVKGAGDFNGDSIDDVLMRHSGGTWATFQMDASGNSPAQKNTHLPTNADWDFAAIADFNGNGRDDMLLRNNVTGDLLPYLSDSNGNGQISIAISPGASWQLITTGDFNGDGRDDLLVHNSVTGDWATFMMNPQGIATGGTNPLLPNSLSSWQYAGKGDFNGNGRTDILLQNASHYVTFLMDASGQISTDHAVATTQWDLAALSDFNSDNRIDLLVRDEISGEWMMLLMDQDGDATQPTYPGLFNQDWDLAGIGNFNGQGPDDVLLRHTSGNWALFTINNGMVQQLIDPNLTHTVSIYSEAVALMLASYGDINDYDHTLPGYLTHVDTVTDFFTGLHAEVFTSSLSSEIYVVIRGSDDPLDWLIANTQAGRPQANNLNDALDDLFNLSSITKAHLIGHSLGGMVAQWTGAYLASQGADEVRVTTLNSPDVGGEIRDDTNWLSGSPDYEVVHLIDLQDEVSRVGFWDSRDAIWLSWLNELAATDALDVHTPDLGDFYASMEFRTLFSDEIDNHIY